MKLFLEMSDSMWKTINELAGAEPGNTLPARKFIIFACARAIAKRKKALLELENDQVKITQIVDEWKRKV